MKLYLFNMLKRYNSTARPSTFDGAPAYDFSFRQPTDYTNPTIDLDVVINKNWNYCYIDDLGAYYWINDITILNSTQSRLHLKKDLLATFRESIRNMNGYVLYAASGYDVGIQDSRISPTGFDNKESVQSADIFSDVGFFSLTCMSKLGGDGFSTTYYLNNANIEQLCNDLYTLSDDIVNRFYLYFGGVASCLQSCNWLPLIGTQEGTTKTGALMIGDTQLDINVSRANGTVQVSTQSIAINVPHQYSDFRRLNMESYQLLLPYVGLVELSSSDLSNTTTINISIAVDQRNGSCVYTVKADTAVIGRYVCNIATSLSIGVRNADTSTKGTIATLTNSLAENIASIIPDISPLKTLGIIPDEKAFDRSELILNKRSWQMVGSQGSQAQSKSDYGNKIVLVHTWRNTTPPDALTENMGRPVQQYGKIANYTGYVKMSGTSFQTQGATLGEINQITAFLNGGFYNE